MNVGERLKQARKSKGYTQDSLANAIGVSRGVISNIEYGKTDPQPLVAHAISEILQIDENWLVSGDGQMESNSTIGKSSQLLLEIYRAAEMLSPEEQDYILDMIKTFQNHRGSISRGEKD